MNVAKGVCIGVYDNHICSKFRMVTYLAGVITNLEFMIYSPQLIKVDVLRYGSNRLRSKLNHVWTSEWSKGKVERPIIKGRGHLSRGSKSKGTSTPILGELGESLEEA